MVVRTQTIGRLSGGFAAQLSKTIDLISLRYMEDMSFQDKVDVLRSDLPRYIKELGLSAAGCIKASKDTTAAFQSCLDLATEINVSVVATRGDAETKVKQQELERVRIKAKADVAEAEKKRVAEELASSKEMLARVSSQDYNSEARGAR